MSSHHEWFFNWCKENHPEILREFLAHAKEAVKEAEHFAEKYG